MRTKNIKRLWPVPATLTVVALAAFLAFGLLATTGAQPAAAQDDPDCELTFTEAGVLDATVHDQSADSNTGRPVVCDAKGDTATVKINGPDIPFTTTDDDPFVRFYIEDSSGALEAFAPGEEPTWNAAEGRYEINAAAVSTKKYRFLKVDIPEVATNPNTGVAGRGSATFTMNKSKGGVVYIYTGTTLDLTEIEDAESTPNDKEKRGLANSEGRMTITFLGVPAIGKDLNTDYNKDLDDEIVMQCRVVDDADNEIVAEGISCTDHDDEPDDQAMQWEAIPENPDQTESRSKLVVRTVADTGILRSADATPIIDGEMETHTIEGADDTITIYAVVEDENGEPLLDTEVSFTTTTMPAGIVASRDLSDEVDTEEVVSDPDATLEDDQIRVTGLDTERDSPVDLGIAIDDDDAVASYTLDSLPDGENDSYRIEVVVMVGDVTLGTAVIARTGLAEKIVAGVFNIDCFKAGDEDDYRDATFNAEAKGCDASGMARRFGADEKFVVKAHHEDIRDLVVGAGSDLSVEFADEDDDLLGDGSLVDLDDPVMEDDPAQAWVYTVDADATLGDHMITVSTRAQNADDEDIASVTLTVTVAGPVEDYGLDGPGVIELGGAAEYTVTATDVNGGVPYFAEDGDNEVAVAVQPVTTLVTGLNASRMLELDEDTGVGKFTVYAALDATHGSAGRIIVGPADNLTIVSISFGGNRAPMAGMAIADQMVDAGSMVMVQSNFSDPDGDMLSYTAMSDMMDVATASVDDMGMVTITGVAMGTATITVTASDPGELYAMQTIMVTIMMMPPMELGAPSITSVMSDADGMATVMLMPGDNATKHYIWAQPTDLSQGMYSDEAAGDADMVTISGLTSGMNYWFIAVAGRGTGADSEWSEWSGWTAETPIQ